jgi:hypothetical protein
VEPPVHLLVVQAAEHAVETPSAGEIFRTLHPAHVAGLDISRIQASVFLVLLKSQPTKPPSCTSQAAEGLGSYKKLQNALLPTRSSFEQRSSFGSGSR